MNIVLGVRLPLSREPTGGSSSPSPVLGVQARRDGHDPTAVAAVSGVPHAWWIDQRLSRGDLDDSLAVINSCTKR